VKVILILTILFFGHEQPIQIQIEQPSIEACVSEVQERLSHDPPDDLRPVMMAAACQKIILKSENP